MGSIPNRRWPRFSLRTLFVLVTVAVVPLGWAAFSWRWILERHEFLTTYKSESAVMLMDEDRNFAPCGLWVLGEQGIELLELNLDDDTPNGETLVDRARRLFPEAEFHWSYRGTSDQ
jgi:hypothetical protein